VAFGDNNRIDDARTTAETRDYDRMTGRAPARSQWTPTASSTSSSVPTTPVTNGPKSA
jgi:hypothetical protein